MTKNILFLLFGILITVMVTIAWRPANRPEPLPESDIPEVLLRSYQIQLINETDAVIYDGYRYVGTISYNTKSQLGKLIYADNR